MKITMFVLLISLLLTASAIAQKVQGVWSLTEITSTGPGGSTQKMSQPSMYLFTKKHYSVIYVSRSEPRPQITDISKANADELRDVFVNSFIANAGTYELKGGKLTMRPMVAKSPAFMEPGTFVTTSIKIDGNVMTLVSDSSNNGPAPNPTTFKLKRIE